MKKRSIRILIFIIGVICIIYSIVQLSSTDSLHEARDHMMIAGLIPFYWMVMLIGGLIVVTLVYVSIRKYIGQKKRANKQRSRK